MVKVLVKRLDSKVKIPEYKTSGSSGMDLMAFIDNPIKIAPNSLKLVPTGLSIAIPEDLHLGKPYPNPFNPVTTIDYDVPLDCEIELSIYDLRGRLVEQLISGYINAGYYEIQWNAETAASGVYFLRMVTTDKAITQKMILMK